MKYLAHITEDREQTVKEHLQGTAELARIFADKFGNGDWGYCCGLLHDIGKYSTAFQKKIRENSNKSVDHSTAGAQVCCELGGLYPLMSYCIAGHHAGLPNHGSKMDSAASGTLMGRRKKKTEDYQKYNEEIEIPSLKTRPFNPQETPNPDFSLSVFIRMLYSCLVDADFLDTEKFMEKGNTGRETGEKIETLFKRLNNHMAEWLENQDIDTVNGRRTEILKACLETGKRGKGLFRLTVPTGGGKTTASLAFALRHAVEHHLDRVIYVVPYTSIIEQNAKVFRDILGEKNVLENHCNVDYEDTENMNPMRLASENWDKPVVVTTNVQFFESLFGHKSSVCRKLHNIANSVIVLDEAQMMPNDYLKPCIAMLEELMRNYGASVLLCTATQPALDSFFQQGIQIDELCPHIEEQFSFFKRTTVENTGALSEENLVDKLKEEFQALCIVNTKKRAQTIYQKLKGEGVYHLSASMYPLHRKRSLEKIKERLSEGKKCILISTSLVEAGVDFDFHTVYRQLAGVDSVIQAAGRCNREGKRKAEDSKVMIFRFDEREYVPGQRQQIDVTKSLLADNRDISELESITDYFTLLYHLRGESLDKKKIMEEFRNSDYNFAKVGKEFKLIEENTKTLFIPIENEARQLLQQLKYKGFTRSGLRKAGQFCINLYENELAKLESAGMIRPVSENIKDFYELVNVEQYTEEMGLKLDVDYGMAVMF